MRKLLKQLIVKCERRYTSLKRRVSESAAPFRNTTGSFLLVVLLLLLSGCATPARRAELPEFAALRTQPEMPNPLAMLDGSGVKTRGQWEKERRPELKEMFEHYMY